MLGRTQAWTALAAQTGVSHLTIPSLTDPVATPAQRGAGLVMFSASLVVSYAASWGPDGDHAKTRLGRRIRSVWWGKRIRAWATAKTGGHRMGTHSLLSVLIVGVLTLVLVALEILVASMTNPNLVLPTNSVWVFPIAAMTGWGVGGIFPDLCTVQGVGLLYPLSRRRFRLLPLRTSASNKNLRVGEWLFRVVVVMVGVWFAAPICL